MSPDRRPVGPDPQLAPARRVVVLGSAPVVDGFALAGAEPVHAEDDDEVRRRWDALPADTALVILTPAAHAALDGRTPPHRHLLAVRMPA